MKITKLARREAKQLFRVCSPNGLLDDQRVSQTVQRLIETKPRGYVAILAHFQRLVQLDIQRRSAHIVSAIALTAEAQASVQANLSRIYGAGLSFSFEQNANLIGGMRIQVGSDVYDGSIQGRLAELKDNF